MSASKLSETELLAFSKTFDGTYEDAAAKSRGEFLQAYPISRLKNMTLDDYVIGLGTASFCARVEAKTKAWANIQGATANKFGIYYGKTKSDPKMKYRFTQKFGTTKTRAFKMVKGSLLNLISVGKRKDFQSIDQNPLSQMFKAKILSLYFPENYLNICSSEHLEIISSELGLPEDLPSSEYQNLLLGLKEESPIAKDWSNPKFMHFLYAKFIRLKLKSASKTEVRKPTKGTTRKINFEELQASWDAIGKVSEEYALAWEKDRLIGLGYEQLVEKIRDRRDTQSLGYDFLSFSTPKQERYIEVKSLGFDRKEECYRFFLSENEHVISKSDEQKSDYYFYLVHYGKDGKPQELKAMKAQELYTNSAIKPCAYIVRIVLEEKK